MPKTYYSFENNGRNERNAEIQSKTIHGDNSGWCDRIRFLQTCRFKTCPKAEECTAIDVGSTQTYRSWNRRGRRCSNSSLGFLGPFGGPIRQRVLYRPDMCVFTGISAHGSLCPQSQNIQQQHAMAIQQEEPCLLFRGGWLYDRFDRQDALRGRPEARVRL